SSRGGREKRRRPPRRESAVGTSRAAPRLRFVDSTEATDLGVAGVDPRVFRAGAGFGTTGPGAAARGRRGGLAGSDAGGVSTSEVGSGATGSDRIGGAATVGSTAGPADSGAGWSVRRRRFGGLRSARPAAGRR